MRAMTWFIVAAEPMVLAHADPRPPKARRVVMTAKKLAATIGQYPRYT